MILLSKVKPLRNDVNRNLRTAGFHGGTLAQNTVSILSDPNSIAGHKNSLSASLPDFN